MRFLSALFLCVLLASIAVAQSATGRIAGTVQDVSGAVIVGATVVATNEETGVSYNTVSSGAGEYRFEALQPGTYTIAVEQASFKRYSTTRNVLTANNTVTIDIPLEVGNITETVEVTGTYERVQTDQSGNTGNVVNERALRELPIVGRNPLSLIAYQPGVQSGSNTTGNTHIFGSRDRAFNVTLDGIDANETSAGSATFSPIRTNPDSLREYRVITSNPSAEFGRNSGAQIALSTMSGTNEFRGNLFWFHRNRVLNANEWELNRVGLNRRFLLRNQFGGSIGGPIIKNRTFFFFNTQFQRQTQTLEQTLTVYTAEARRGNFRYVVGARNRPFGAAGASVDAQGNPLPGLTIAQYNVITNDVRGLGANPTTQSIIGLTALPNTFEVGDGLNTAGYRYLATRTDPERDFNIRLDHTFSQNHNMFGRYSFGQENTVGDTGNAGAARFPGLPPIVATFRTPKNLAIGLRSTLSDTTTNELIVGGNRFLFDFVIPANLDERTTPVILASVSDPLSNSFGNLRRLTTYQVLDNVSHVRGAHTFRFGANLRLQQHYDVRGSVAGADVNPLYFIGGTVNASVLRNIPTNVNSFDVATLNGLANNMLGRVSSASVGLVDMGGEYGPVGTPFTFDAWYPEMDLYFQDDWKIRPNLTLNLGLRWEPKPKPFARGDSTILVPDRPLTLGSAPASDVTFVEGDLYRSDWNNFGPAIGMAWDPFGDGRTAIRANFRIAFDRISTFLPSSAIFPNSPGTTTSSGFTVATGADVRLSDPLPALTTTASPQSRRTPPAPGLPSTALEVLDPNFQTPTTYMYSIGFQREIGRGVVIDAQYIGRSGRHLIGGYERNQVKIFNNGFLEAFTQAQAGNVPTGGLLDRLTRPARGSQTVLQYINTAFSSTALANNNVAGLAAFLNTRFVTTNGQSTRLVEAAGFDPYFFNDYPQFLGGLQVIDSDSYSNYHGLVLQLQRRFAQGLDFNVSYTLSKSKDDKSYDPVFTRISGGTGQSAASTPYDANDRSLNYGTSDFDRTHALQGSVIYDLPFGPGRRYLRETNGFVSRLVGGFTLSTNFVYQSGLPFTIFAGSNTYSNRNSSLVNYSGGSFSPRYTVDPATGNMFLFTAEERAQFSIPAPGEIGNTPRNSFRLPPRFNMDLALIKRIGITERVNIELRAEASNVTNTPYFGFPNSGVTLTSGSTFTRNTTTESGARIIQMGIKLNF